MTATKQTTRKPAIKIYWTNHGRFSNEQFADLPEALRYAQRKGVDAVFIDFTEGTAVLGAWDAIGGYRAMCKAGESGYTWRTQKSETNQQK
jgi:hypothetical protein